MRGNRGPCRPESWIGPVLALCALGALLAAEAGARRNPSWRELSARDPYWVSFLAVKRYFPPYAPPAGQEPRVIYCLGGSVAAGYPFAHAGFAEWMGRMLDRADSGRFAVRARGLGGFATRRAAHVLREALGQHRPWAVVIYAGHNEILEQSLYARVPFVLRGGWGRALWRCALVTQACRSAGAGWRKPLRAGAVRGLWGLPQDMFTPVRDSVLPGYRKRLAALVRQTRAAGAIPVLCTTPVNLRFPLTLPPGADLPPAERRIFFQAWRFWREGRPGAALVVLKSLSSGHDAPYVRWLTGECALELGNHALGVAELKAADEANPTASDAMRRAQREVAKQEGAVLVDLDAIWSRMTPEGLAPADYFSDNHHLSLRGYRDAAYRVLKVLEAEGKLAAGSVRPLADRAPAAALQELGLGPEHEVIQHGLMASELSLYGDNSGLDWFHEQAIAHLRAGLAAEPRLLLNWLRLDHPAVMLDLACAYAREGGLSEARVWAGRAKSSAAAWEGVRPEDDGPWARQARRLLQPEI